MSDQHWPVLLFNKSILKQNKFKQITDLLGETHQLQCLDVGSDNGVISYLLRKRGGIWKSADLDEKAVKSIVELVKHDVFQIDGRRIPAANDEFDRVVIVDFLEHIPSDHIFIDELYRVIKPGGELIINVPHIKNSLLRRFRLLIGQTDEKHGHIRQGYTLLSLSELIAGRFTILQHRTYSKFFSECLDTLIALSFDIIKREPSTGKGVLITGSDLRRNKIAFTAYSLLYPLAWILTRLDGLLSWQSGYMLIIKAKKFATHSDL